MNTCIFCDISKGLDLQTSNVIYEDNLWQALLVKHPHTFGHFIVYPRNHIESLQAMGSLLGELALKAAELGEILIEALKADSFYLHINNGVHKVIPGDVHVAHLHIHVAPRYGVGDGVEFQEGYSFEDYIREVKLRLGNAFIAFAR
jgi:diadenosine tetraphosphate (Ap4A) HIT family hydrolase